MPDVQENGLIETISATPLGRRQMLGSVAALSMAGLATPAFAGASGAAISEFRACYGIHGGHSVTGFFAKPRSTAQLPVLVVMPGADEVRVRTEATARRYAQAGHMVIAPDLAATFKGRRIASHDAMVAEFMALVPGLKRLPSGNGTVTVVSA